MHTNVLIFSNFAAMSITEIIVVNQNIYVLQFSIRLRPGGSGSECI